MFGVLLTSDIPNIPDIPDIGGIIGDPPTIPDFSHILDLWTFKDLAMEVTHMMQEFFARLPAVFIAFFAISLLFLVVPLIYSLVMKIL